MSSARLAEIIQFIFPHGGALAESCAAWADATPRFAAFLQANSTKIRKKARNSGQDGQDADLRAELAMAAMLLADRRAELVYEPTASSGQRGPDFAVRFRINTLIYLEVAHLRPGSQSSHAARMAGVLAAKARQLQPGAANVLAVIMAEALSFDEIGRTMLELRQRAERGQTITHMRDVDPPTLLRLLPRLSALLAVTLDGTPTVWPHPNARHSLPPDFLHLLRQAHLPF